MENINNLPLIITGVNVERAQQADTYKTLFELIQKPYYSSSMRTFTGMMGEFGRDFRECFFEFADVFLQAPLFTRTTHYVILNGGLSLLDQSPQERTIYAPVPFPILTQLVDTFQSKNPRLEPIIFGYDLTARCYFPLKK